MCTAAQQFVQQYQACAFMYTDFVLFCGIFYRDFHCYMIPRQNGDRASLSPGTSFHAPVSQRIGLQRPIFRRRQRGRSCGVGVARSRGLDPGGTGDARESRFPAAHAKTEIVYEMQDDGTTTAYTRYTLAY